MIKKILIAIIGGIMSLQFASFTLADDSQSVIEAIVSDPNYYDGKEVTVEGEVEKVHHTKSGSGDPYTLFRLHDDEDNKVGVYSKGNLQISRGTKLRVRGKFKKEKQALIFKFKNVIKAKEVEEIG